MSVAGWFDIAGTDDGWFDSTAYSGGWFSPLAGGADNSVGAPAPLPHLGLLLEPVTDFGVSGDAGAYVLTGQDATLLRGSLVAGSAGAYTLSGQSAGLLYGWRLAGADGAYALTGQDATLTYVPNPVSNFSEFPAPLPHLGLILGAVTGYTGVSDPGAFVWSGQAAGMYRRYTHVCAVGSYALTGQDATLTKTGANSTQYPAPLPHLSSLLGGVSGAYSLPAFAGSFTRTGVAATLARGIGLIAAQGSYVWTGAPALRDMQLTAEGAAFAITGVDPVFTATHHPLTADPGSYAWTGFAAGMQYEGAAKTLTAFVGTFDVTGQDAAFTHGLALVAEPGSFEVTASDVGYETTGQFEVAQGGWYGHGGEWDDDSLYSRMWKPIPREVARAIDKVVRKPKAKQKKALREEVEREGIEWEERFARVLDEMRARDAKSLQEFLDIREQVAQEVQRMRDDEDAVIALLIS